MDQLGVPTQLAIAAGTVVLALIALGFLVRQVRKIAPMIKNGGDMRQHVEELRLWIDDVSLIETVMQIQEMHDVVCRQATLESDIRRIRELLEEIAERGPYV